LSISITTLRSDINATSGEYFLQHPQIIDNAIYSAIKEYGGLVAIENATYITTANGILTYDLPSDFKELIDLFRDMYLYASLYTSGFIDLGNGWLYNVNPPVYYLDVMLDKMEYYRLVEVQPKITNYSINSANKTITFNSVPDPYAEQITYIIYYYAYPTEATIPDYHYDYIYKLASSILMSKQALAMSKIVQTAGPGVTSTFVQPQVLLTLAKDIKAEVVNALANYIPERG
jgi:hypothetical protein